MGSTLPHNHEVRMAGAQLLLLNAQFEDSGTYSCEAVNLKGKDYHHANVSVEANPEWVEHIVNTEKDLHSDYTMSCNAKVKRVLAPKNGRVVIECRPKAAPKPTFTWSKDTELLSNSSRMFIWENGSLEILNVMPADEGRYTCFAENDWGKANSTHPLVVTGKLLLI
ncbi:hypothetical protein GOODEAATRI_006440 [Goodea atripinnis]|uniref:Ig-like domain-containing protein n=1 Tax=Goodea atripinnis TaxID=208336 RepID=A0ABV0P1Z6_9TELE